MSTGLKNDFFSIDHLRLIQQGFEKFLELYRLFSYLVICNLFFIYVKPKTGVMKRTLISMAFFLLMLSAGLNAQRKPSVFPGALPISPGNEVHFLVNASYDEVKAFYVDENGEPRRVDDVGETGKRAFFQYYARMPDPDGVYIDYRTGHNRAVSRVFSELRGLMTIGHISQEEFNDLEKKYMPLRNYFYLKMENDEGELMGEEEIIFEKYRKKMGGAAEEADYQAMMEKAQELMAAGRMQEGAELMKKAQSGMLEGLQTAVSEEAVEIWIECLEEMAASSYPVSVSIHYFPD